MYEKHFGLRGSPFRLTPDRRFYFESEGHRKAMSTMRYGLHLGDGFIVITGDVGTGKSTLVEQIFAALDFNEIVATRLNTTQINPEDTMRLIVTAFDIEPKSWDKAALLTAFEEFLVEQHELGRRVLLIVDEAQNLPVSTLEELRMLSNFNIAGQPLFQCFLVGQSQFAATLERKELHQLHQRVIAWYRLEPLTRKEVHQYILHRLRKAGWKGVPEWLGEAADRVSEITSGVPRRINGLCNRAMLYACLEDLRRIDANVIDAVLADMKSEKAGLPSPLAEARRKVQMRSGQSLPVPSQEAPARANGRTNDADALAEQMQALIARVRTIETRLSEHSYALGELIDATLGLIAENKQRGARHEDPRATAPTRRDAS